MLTALLLFIWGYSFLKGKDIFSTYVTYYVIYDNVEGLNSSSPVTINGLPIGKVSKITLTPKGRLVVEIQVKTDFIIPKSSIIEAYEPSPIGGKQIAIIPNMEDFTPAKSGDTLEGRLRAGLISRVSDQIAPIQERLQSTLAGADSLMMSLNKVLDDKNKENLAIALEQLTETMKHMNAASKTMNGMLANNEKNINNTLSNLNKTSDNFAKLSDSLAKLNAAKMVKDIENTLSSINTMMSELQSGKGTMGKLMKDENLYNNLSNASRELELLLQDVRLNPTRYINVSLFGKKNKPYVAPKENE